MAKTKIAWKLNRADAFWITERRLIIDPEDLENVLPNESIHAFDLNCMSLTVGMYNTSRTGELNPYWSPRSATITMKTVVSDGFCKSQSAKPSVTTGIMSKHFDAPIFFNSVVVPKSAKIKLNI